MNTPCHPLPREKFRPRHLESRAWDSEPGISDVLHRLLFAIPAVICGHVALGRIKRSGGTLAGEGLAQAGLITGYVTLAFRS